MKTFFCSLLFLCIFCVSAISQIPKFTETKTFSEKANRYFNFKVIGYDDSTAYYYYLTPKGAFLQEFNINTLELTSEDPIELPGDNNAIKSIEKTIDDHLHRQIYFITSSYNKEEDYYKLYSFTLNYFNEMSNPVLLYKISYKEYTEVGKCNFQYSNSLQYLLIYHELGKESKAAHSLKLKLVNLKEEEKAWKKNIQFPENKPCKLDTVIVNNQGSIILGTSFRKKNNDIISILLWCYSKANTDGISRTVDFGSGETPVDYYLFPDDSLHFNFIALYSTKDSYYSNGYYLLQMSAKDIEIVKTEKHSFSDEELKQYIFTKKKGQAKGFPSMNIRSVNRLPDSGWVITSEVKFYSGLEGFTFVSCYDDIVSTRISSKGKILNSIVVPKSLFKVSDINLDYFIHTSEKEIKYYFWDVPANFENGNRIRNRDGQSAVEKMILVMATINEEGIISYSFIKEFSKRVKLPLLENCAFVRDDQSEILCMAGVDFWSAYSYSLVKLSYR